MNEIKRTQIPLEHVGTLLAHYNIDEQLAVGAMQLLDRQRIQPELMGIRPSPNTYFKFEVMAFRHPETQKDEKVLYISRADKDGNSLPEDTVVQIDLLQNR